MNHSNLISNVNKTNPQTKSSKFNDFQDLEFLFSESRSFEHIQVLCKARLHKNGHKQIYNIDSKTYSYWCLNYIKTRP